MNPAVIFGDIEVALADHLAAVLADRGVSVPVVNAVPAERPTRFVRVARIGGLTGNLVTDRPRVVAECNDTLGTGAHDLGALVRALIGAIAPGYVGSVWVDKVKDLGLISSPDPDTNTPRYIVTAELFTTGTALPD
ncbi:hypothetical protein OIE68_15565 [Nocardia vinacea]|uniref:hypothetical protein n=1 Tax=Nocardia vinacea TaxID=96468 RepID=UPI002E12E5F0|nr:hypothetical protein OIE68_15565 [Nocardia vinacea]